MKQIIYPNNEIPIDKKIVFLAGPTFGSLYWRNELINLLNDIDSNFMIANPQLIKSYDFDLIKQIQWESKSMNLAFNNGCLLFWLANNNENVINHAKTTRFEIAEFLMKYKFNNGNIVIGIDKEFVGREYIEYKIKSETDLKIANNFKELIDLLVEKI